MERGEGLTDEDRWGWLASVRSEVAGTVAAGAHRVFACSALKRSYREFLLDEHVVEPGRAVAVYLRTSEPVARVRTA